MDIQAQQDRIEIHELLYKYARSVDTNDWAGYISVFTEDAVLDYSSMGFPVGSRDQIAAIFSAGMSNLPWTQHMISNIQIELDGDRAIVTAMFLNPMQHPDLADISVCGGYYHHRLVRTADGWKSEHLVEENRWFKNRPAKPSDRTVGLESV